MPVETMPKRLRAFVATLAAIAVLAPSLAESSALGAAARTAVKRVLPVRTMPRAVKESAVHLFRHASGKPRDVLVSAKKYPEAAAHIEYAQRLGQPTVLTLDRLGASSQRRAALKSIKRRPEMTGLDRDEYPFAITKEGGASSNVRYIGAGDNRGAGKTVERQIRDLPDGARIRVLVTH